MCRRPLCIAFIASLGTAAFACSIAGIADGVRTPDGGLEASAPNDGAAVDCESGTCTDAGTAAGFPNASNTGVPPGTTLEASGSITVTKNGTTLDALDVTGCITVNADDVTIKRTRVIGGGCAQPIHVGTGKNLQVFDTEIDGQKSASCNEAIGANDYSITRVNAHGCSSGPRLAGTGPINIVDSFIHDLSRLDGDHSNGIQAFGLDGGTVTIKHNTIEGGTTSAFLTADEATGDMFLDNNLFSGGGYTVRLYDNHVSFTNNLVVKDSYDFGPLDTFRDPDAADKGVTIVAWSNNHLCDNPDGTGIGDEIAQP